MKDVLSDETRYFVEKYRYEVTVSLRYRIPRRRACEPSFISENIAVFRFGVFTFAESNHVRYRYVLVEVLISHHRVNYSNRFGNTMCQNYRISRLNQLDSLIGRHRSVFVNLFPIHDYKSSISSLLSSISCFLTSSI